MFQSVFSPNRFHSSTQTPLAVEIPPQSSFLSLISYRRVLSILPTFRLRNRNRFHNKRKPT
jgi:hypothetical protein